MNRILKILIQVLIFSMVIHGENGPALETHQFNTEVSRLMDILINSLYTQKEIFLREVISNASDALDKIRFMSLKDPSTLGDKKQLQIRISVNEEKKYVSVRDTGVGMTREDMINNLGTIAKSGTTQFIEALKGGNINLIGQFGVGFYSTFLAGSKVQVLSKSNDDEQYKWVSDTASEYQIEKDPQGNTLGRGTQVRIYLKEDAMDFLSHRKLSKLVKKYSEFIEFPIYLNNKKQVEVDAEQQNQEANTQDQDIEIKQKDKTEQDKPKKVKKTVYQWERVNAEKALWLRDKDDIYEEDYIDFYKSISHQSNPPLNWIHFQTEGQVMFTSLLYIPNRAPFDFYSSYNTRKNELKLYVRRVLITQNNEELIPKYLSFVTGVIDSDDLPLNVNRETLVQSKTFKVINQKITKKILDMITDISKWDFIEEDQYLYEEDQEESGSEDEVLTDQEQQAKNQKAKQEALEKKKQNFINFYREFGKAIKIGIIDDKNNRVKLASLARWYSTHNSSQLTSLDEYMTRMKSIQDQIYFFSGQDKQVLEKSPLVVGLVRKGYEVLLCDDPIDEYVFNVLRQYQGKNIVNVGKGDFNMPQDDQFERKKLKYLTKKYEKYVQYAKKLLFEKIDSVEISNRLVNEPCVVVAGSYGPSSFMDKISKAQMFANQDQNPKSVSKKIFEINPHHKINQIILQKIENGQTNQELEQLVFLLYETAAFNSGFSVSDPNDFSGRFYNTYSKAMGVMSLQRNQLEVGDIQLDQTDYQGQNEAVTRVHPSDVEVITGQQED